MKKIIAGLLLVLFSVNAFADRSGDVFGAAIIGLMAGKVLAENEYHRAPPPPPPQYNPPLPQTVCPYPYVPFFERVWVYDAYGRQVLIDRFVGCR